MFPIRHFKIDDYSAVLSGDYEVTQTYAYLNENKPQRKMDGTSYMQQQWGGKLATAITGTGVMPEGLGTFGIENPKVPHFLYCLAPREYRSSSNVISIQAGSYRIDQDDVSPRGYAVHSRGMLTPSTISIVGNEITIAPVTGADGYLLTYRPILSVWITSVKHQNTGSKNAFQWSLEAEQI